MTSERSSNGSGWKSQAVGPQEQSPNSTFDLTDSIAKNTFYWPYILCNSDSVASFRSCNLNVNGQHVPVRDWPSAVVVLDPEDLIISQQLPSGTFRIKSEGPPISWVMHQIKAKSTKSSGILTNGRHSQNWFYWFYRQSLSLEWWHISRFCTCLICSVSRSWQEFWCLFSWGWGHSGQRFQLARLAETHCPKSLTLFLYLQGSNLTVYVPNTLANFGDSSYMHA